MLRAEVECQISASCGTGGHIFVACGTGVPDLFFVWNWSATFLFRVELECQIFVCVELECQIFALRGTEVPCVILIATVR